MRICILDGEMILNKEMLHSTLAGAMDFPDWYGRNLDALYDCLTDMTEETEIRIRNENALTEHLGNYAEALKKALRAAAEENHRIRWGDEKRNESQSGRFGS